MKTRNSSITTKIVTADTSYKDLKAMVPDASKLHTPKGATLVNSDSEILIRVRQDSATVIVYRNGFFAYINDQGSKTARAVANCHVMMCEKAEGGFELIEEEVFEVLPFPVVLSHFGMLNIEDQKRKQVKRHENISLDAEQIPDDPRLSIPDFADELVTGSEEDIWEKRKELLPEALESLKPKQKKAILMYYIEKKTYEQVAKEIGGDKTSAFRMVQRATKKLEKYFFEKRQL